jgi:enamine deaminase RidA (YjgF/YER057c/UK114 family)
MPRTAINSPDYTVPIDGFSQVVIGTPGAQSLFVSGLTARSRDGSIVAPDDMAGQARQVLENLRTVVEAAGATLDDVVQIHTYVTDITLWDDIESVWRDYWGRVWPASTLVQIERLFDERMMIEMDATALIYPGVSSP